MHLRKDSIAVVSVKNTDGISHGVADQGMRPNAWLLRTVCGLTFEAWTYAGKGYGIWRQGETRPELRRDSEVDCMACVAGIQVADTGTERTI